MEDVEQQQPKPPNAGQQWVSCSCANNEPKDQNQTRWWWAFIASLLATASMSATALAVLIYTDYYKPADAPDEQTTELTPPRTRPSRRGPGHDIPDSLKTVVSVSMPRPNPSPVVEAYLGKTLRDVRQELIADSNRFAQQPQPPPPQAIDMVPDVPPAQPVGQEPAGFVNLTPESAKSPVTVVDLTTSRRAKQPAENSFQMTNQRPMMPTAGQSAPSGRNRIEQPSNLASLTSTPIPGPRKKRRRRVAKKKMVSAVE